MSVILKIGEQKINQEELYPLLAKYQMLPKLAREIIIDKAIKQIECNEEEIQTAKQQFCQQYQLEKEEQIADWLNKQGMTSEQWHNLLARGIKIQKFKEITWNGELESYFIQRKPQLDQVVYSLIRNHDAGIIQELYFRIQENENSFAQLAMDYSEGEEAKTGGLIGPVEINTPHPKIAQMLKSSRAGQVWAPTRVGDWFVIVRLEKFITAHLDEAMKQRLRDELFQQWLKKQMKTLVSYYESEHN